jgi:hypothetical protein
MIGNPILQIPKTGSKNHYSPVRIQSLNPSENHKTKIYLPNRLLVKSKVPTRPNHRNTPIYQLLEKLI